MKKKLIIGVMVLAMVVTPINYFEAIQVNAASVIEEQPVQASTTKASTKKKVTLKKIHNAVKKAYGENYIPNTTYDQTALKEIFGLNPSWYSNIIAEGPMINVHVDTFLAVKAKKGKAGDIKKALEKYKDYLINESFQYPMNIPKVQAAEIVQYDNYVFFIMLGQISSEEANNTDETVALKAFQKQNQIGVQAIKKTLAK